MDDDDMDEAAEGNAEKPMQYMKWEACEDMNTLLRADEIRKSPQRMKFVRRAAKEKLAEIEGLRALAKGTSK